MSLFQICPSDPSVPAMELVTSNAADVLNMVQRMHCKEADVMRDGDYFTSVRLSDCGSWVIFRREDSSAPVMPVGQ